MGFVSAFYGQTDWSSLDEHQSMGRPCSINVTLSFKSNLRMRLLLSPSCQDDARLANRDREIDRPHVSLDDFHLFVFIEFSTSLASSRSLVGVHTSSLPWPRVLCFLFCWSGRFRVVPKCLLSTNWWKFPWWTSFYGSPVCDKRYPLFQI
jgi:hypothetical protein